MCFSAILGWFHGRVGDTSQQAAATLVIYRQSDFQSSGFTLKANGQKVSGNFRAKSTLTFQVPPGQTLIETSGSIFVEKKVFSLEVKGGETYYLEAFVEYDFLSNSLYLVRRDEATALKVIDQLTSRKKQP
jgi:hypothetical protein